MSIYQRRDFLRQAAILGAAFSIFPSGILRAASKLRMGVIGSGQWALQYLPLVLQHPDLDLRAVCDHSAGKLAPALDLVRRYGKEKPEIYTGKHNAWEQLLASKNIDAILIATPWQLHYKMALHALNAGKHVICGPVVGVTPAQHQSIVQASIRSGKQYITLDENDFDRPLMAAGNMVQQGFFGDVQSVHTGISCMQLPGLQKDALPYALKGSGVAASSLGIGIDNPFVSVSLIKEKMEFIQEKQYSAKKQIKLVHQLGMVPLVKATTAKGQTLFLQQEHGKTPYAIGFRINGSKGQWLESTRSIYRCAEENTTHQWEGARTYLEQYDHPVWHSTTPESTSIHQQALNNAVGILQKGNSAAPAVYAAAGMSILNTMAGFAVNNEEVETAVPSFVLPDPACV